MVWQFEPFNFGIAVWPELLQLKYKGNFEVKLGSGTKNFSNN
jgi:hypothetical protein